MNKGDFTVKEVEVLQQHSKIGVHDNNDEPYHNKEHDDSSQQCRCFNRSIRSESSEKNDITRESSEKG